MLDGLYRYRLGNVGCAVSIYRLGNVWKMLDGLYRYRLGNVGWAVSIEVRQCWMGCIDIG